MALDGVNNGQVKQQQSTQESFASFAEKLNRTIPSVSHTIDQKKDVIAIKKKIMAHPQCPHDTKVALRKEISTIEDEIKRMQQETAVNTSIFGRRNDLG